MKIRYLAVVVLLLAGCRAGDDLDVGAMPTVVVSSATEAPVLAEAETATATVAATATGQATAEEAATATEGLSATEEPPATEMAVSEEALAASAEAEVAVDGRTEDGAYFLGRADAPLTMIEYSDFL